MSKILSKQREINALGSNYVEKIFIEMHAQFEPIYIDFDFGYDCYINFTEEKKIKNIAQNRYLPLVMRAQLKSGDTHLKKTTDKHFVFNLKEKDISVWKESNTPVLFIFYYTSENKAYWVNLRDYINRVGYSGTGNLNLEIPKNNELTKYSYIELIQILYKEQKGIYIHDLLIYKPIYDFLIGEYNKLADKGLIQFQNEYENNIKSIYDKNSYDNEKVRISINFALSQRRLYSLNIAINNLKDLDHRLKHKNQHIDNKLLFKIKYFLAVMKLENNEFQDAESYLSLAIKIDPNFIKDKKYFLMQALILCGQNKVDESITIFESLLVNPITKATLLMGLIKMFIGIMYRENDDYQKSEFYFNKAKFDLMKDKYYYSILLSNYGNLYHVKEDYDNAILFYNKAISILSKLAEWDAVSALYSNLSNVMYDRFYLNDKAENKGWEYFRESVRLKQKKDYEMILNYKYNGLINYLYELFSLASKSKSKLSYNYTDAFNYLKNSENLCKNLGDYSGRKNVKYLSAISTFLLGKETNQKELFHSSLCNFILNCSKEGIEAIAEHGFNYLNEFIDILHWTFTFKGDRNALNGRLIFYKEFSDYIPEVDIPKVFEILCTFESKEYSLWSSHDYGRNSIEVLKKLTNRLNKTQTNRLLRILIRNISSENRIKFDANIELLEKINYSLINLIDAKKIIKLTKTLLNKVDDKYDIYLVWQNIMYSHRNLLGYVYKIVSNKFYKDKENFHLFEYLILSNTLFAKFRDIEIDNSMVDYFCEILNSEVKRETINNFGAGGYDITKILSRICMDIDKNNILKIIELLINYLDSDNLVPYKRTQCVKSLQKLIQYLESEKKEKLNKVLIKIINSEFDDVKSRYLSENDFDGPYFDYIILKAESISCFLLMNNEKYKLALNKYTELFSQIFKESTFKLIIIMFGNLAILLEKQNGLEEVKEFLNNYLFQQLYNSNTDILNWSVKFLSQTVDKTDSIKIDTLIIRLHHLSKNNNTTVRWIVANACSNLVKRKIESVIFKEIIELLSTDLSFEVRNEVKQIKFRAIKLK